MFREEGSVSLGDVLGRLLNAKVAVDDSALAARRIGA
jgi:hypothetical protein